MKPHFVDIVTDTDLSSLKHENLAEWLYRRKMIVLRDLDLDLGGFYDLFSRFVKPWPISANTHLGNEVLSKFDETRYAMIYDNEDKNTLQGHLGWHSDQPLARFGTKVYDYPVRALYAANIPNPKEGITSWLDRGWVIDKRPDLVARAEKTTITITNRWRTPGRGGDDETRPLISVHPVTKRKIIELSSFTRKNSGFRQWIVDSSEDGKDGYDLLNELTIASSAAENVYEHMWRKGDFIIWSNFDTMHKRTDFTQTSDNRRIHYRLNGFNTWQ